MCVETCVEDDMEACVDACMEACMEACVEVCLRPGCKPVWRPVQILHRGLAGTLFEAHVETREVVFMECSVEACSDCLRSLWRPLGSL